jgi:hypothetical protein
MLNPDDMYEESVITPVQELNNVFYIVPSAIEDQFVDMDCDTAKYEYARLDIMLEIINAYKAMPAHVTEHNTAHFHFSKTGLGKGMLAKVTPVNAVK